MTVVAFVCVAKPISANASGWRLEKRKEQYRKILQSAYIKAGGVLAINLCYGIVYYITRRLGKIDADNISKRTWDVLQNVAYEDDAVIRLRIAGVLDPDGDFTELDLSAVPDQAAADLLALAGQVDDLLYIEIGPLSPGLYRFALAKEAK